MTSYSGVTWRVDYGEISEREQFRVGRLSLESYDAYFPLSELTDLLYALSLFRADTSALPDDWDFSKPVPIKEAALPKYLQQTELSATIEQATEDATSARTARKVIVSTDWYTDCDDVAAFRVLRKAELAGLIDILCVVVDTAAPNGAPSLDGFLRYEGRQVQIGQIDGFSTDLKAGGPYQASMMTTLPHLGTSATAYPEAVKVLRTALAASADGEVDVISIGYLNALSKLLDSPADTISSKTGAQLIAQKVRHTWVMGGAYPGGAAMPMVTGSTDIGIPIEALRAVDVPGSDGDAVAAISAVGSTTTPWAIVSGNEPTIVASKSGTIADGSTVTKRALKFSGNQWLTTVATYDRQDFTAYVRVLWDAVPTSNQTVLARDAGAGVRGEHLKAISGGIAQAVRWNGGSAVTDDTAAGITAGRWHTLAFRCDSGSLEAFLDGASNGGYSGAVIPTAGALAWRLGANLATGGEKVKGGYIAEVRIFNMKHTDDKIAAYVANMA